MHSAHDLDTRWPALDIAARRARLIESFNFSPGVLASSTEARSAVAERAAAGLFRRDPSVWTSDAAVKQKIANRLGWLTSPRLMAESLDRLQAFAGSVKQVGFSEIVLLGLGGSSLAPEVLRAVLGAAPGYPRLQMLDSTDPSAIRAAATDPSRTLYILASKSGTTIEPNALAAHFRGGLEAAGIARWADHFIAITDDGTALAAQARAERFRETFINPGDIGGRYSALSFFGLVPAALMGQDIGGLVGWGLAMLEAAEGGTGDTATNPAVALGLALGVAARAGRDKATLIVPPALEPFGLWIEQLVAESTGKQGLGVVPIAGETPGPPDVYGSDRLFVHMRRYDAAGEDAREQVVSALRAGGAPVATIDLDGPPSLGAEFVRWEIATAVAGALLGINPFDEPNVQQAKDATRALLNSYQAQGTLPALPPDHTTGNGTVLTLSQAARAALNDRGPEAILRLLREADYCALLAYLGPDADLARAMQAFRHDVRDRRHNATMLGYGPRYLHSTGQLHKGGPNTGVFVLVSATPVADLPIPGEVFSFGTLELAQARGDFQSLEAAGRRALHVHLPSPDHRLLQAVLDSLLG